MIPARDDRVGKWENGAARQAFRHDRQSRAGIETAAAHARAAAVKNDRLKILVEPAYASALGLAVYAFAGAEWNAIRCCERIRPGSVDALMDRTAGRVADTLASLAGTLSHAAGRQELEGAAADFRAYVSTRNNLLHAKPGVDAEGRDRLFRDGDQWTIGEMERVADAFSACSLRLAAWLDRSGAGA